MTREICSQPFTRPRSSQARSLRGQAVCSWSSVRRFDILEEIAVIQRSRQSRSGWQRQYSPGPFRLICMLRSRAELHLLCVLLIADHSRPASV